MSNSSSGCQILVRYSGLFWHQQKIVLERCQWLPDKYVYFFSKPELPKLCTASCTTKSNASVGCQFLVLDSWLFGHQQKTLLLNGASSSPIRIFSNPSCPNCVWNHLQQCPTFCGLPIPSLQCSFRYVPKVFLEPGSQSTPHQLHTSTLHLLHQRARARTGF